MTLTEIDENRLSITKTLKQANRLKLGQFFTPMSIAKFMASWFTNLKGDIQLLDPGAGIGSLSTAFLDRVINSRVKPKTINIKAYEIDQSLIHHLTQHLNSVGNLLPKLNVEFSFSVMNEDFILEAAEREAAGLFTKADGKPLYTHAILNPPYKKIPSDSAHRLALRKLNIETANLYSGFLAVALRLMQDKGEVVAIIPRSFCNGSYFLPFRKYLLENAAIKQIHLFDSRSEAFNDDDVLQENVILHLVKGEKQGNVTISKSTDAKFDDLRQFSTPFSRIVKEGDDEVYFHIPEEAPHEFEQLKGISFTLNDLGINISTGPVVDFRMKEYLRQNPEIGTVPLLYSNHFGQKEINYPVVSKKPNAITYNEVTKRWLSPSGYYTLTKRFSSKEENQRIVARVTNPESLPGDVIGIENHLNYFHIRKAPLGRVMAYGLAAYLNASLVDNHFRMFSGHTQVNATDLKKMLYPSLQILEQLGEWAILQNSFKPTDIDQQLRMLLKQSHN